MESIQWLISQAESDFNPNSFNPAEVASNSTLDLMRDRDYTNFLAAQNGLFAFSRSLHIFGSGTPFDFHNVDARNRGRWKSFYGNAIEGIEFFAEDVFGHLFGLKVGVALSFDPESMEMNQLGHGFRGWVEYLVGDLNFATGKSLAAEYLKKNGPLAYGERLSPIKPFVLGGDFELENLRPMPWERNLEWKATIYSKTHNLPDGAQIELKVE
jgi:hypothetical protein